MESPGVEQKYNFDVVRWFTVVTVIYFVVGTFVGVYIAAELAWPFLNFDSPYITFGRLRPLHTQPLYHFWPAQTAAHKRRNLRLWRLYINGERFLQRATYLRRAPVER